MSDRRFDNPFKPGAGHKPPYLAGRDKEQRELRKLLKQTTILENMVLTGLRGVGKTVLLETFKPIAQSKKWLWVGQDVSESASITERHLAERIITDLSVLTSSLLAKTESQLSIGFASEDVTVSRALGYADLKMIFDDAPGLTSDKLKAVLIYVWRAIPPDLVSGIVFAYDEAQNLADHSKKEQYPLSMLLDVFQSLQRSDIPYLLILTGLPTLFPKLVEARTYTERMFHIVFLRQLSDRDCQDAILKPIEESGCPLAFSAEAVQSIIRLSGGYPYFIQFVCKEVFDSWIAQIGQHEAPSVPTQEITRKLDNDFFSGRWSRTTDRQRHLMQVIATLPSCDEEFTVQEIVSASKDLLQKPFSSSHVNQMLSSLADHGLIYKNRHGKYSFAVPMLSEFIRRQLSEEFGIRY